MPYDVFCCEADHGEPSSAYSFRQDALDVCPAECDQVFLDDCCFIPCSSVDCADAVDCSSVECARPPSPGSLVCTDEQCVELARTTCSSCARSSSFVDDRSSRAEPTQHQSEYPADEHQGCACGEGDSWACSGEKMSSTGAFDFVASKYSPFCSSNGAGAFDFVDPSQPFLAAPPSYPSFASLPSPMSAAPTSSSSTPRMRSATEVAPGPVSTPAPDAPFDILLDAALATAISQARSRSSTAPDSSFSASLPSFHQHELPDVSSLQLHPLSDGDRLPPPPSQSLLSSQHTACQHSSQIDPLFDLLSSPLDCQWTDCGQSFTRIGDLVEHFRTTESHVPDADWTMSDGELSDLAEALAQQERAAAREQQQQHALRCLWGSDPHILSLAQTIHSGGSTISSQAVEPSPSDALLRHLLEDHLGSVQAATWATTCLFPPSHPSHPSQFHQNLQPPPSLDDSLLHPLVFPPPSSNPSSLSSNSFSPHEHSSSCGHGFVSIHVASPLEPTPSPSASLGLAPISSTSSPGLVPGSHACEIVHHIPHHPLPSVEGLTAEHRCGWTGCNLLFPDTASLTEHLNSAHVGSGKESYTCGWAGCERGAHGPIFKSKQKIMRHLQSHTGHRPFECETCHERFSEAATLKQHMRRHTNERPFVCDVAGCGKAFSLVASLTIHKRTHDGIKPFKCPHCDRAFVEASNLTKHIRTHTGDKPFPCVHPGCEKRFARPDQLTRHQAVHARAADKTKDRVVKVKGGSKSSTGRAVKVQKIGDGHDVGEGGA